MPPFGRLRWTRRVGVDRVVWINVHLLEASWQRSARYVGRGGLNGIEGRYEQFGRWLTKHFPGPIWMPEIAIDDGEVDFSDGRHRFAWLRDRGVKSLPIAINPSQMAELAPRFGTESGTSWLPAGR